LIATEELLATFEAATPETIDRALFKAQKAFPAWRDCSFSERARVMRGAVSYLRKHKLRLANLMTAEVGKPIAQSEAEVEKCAWNCETETNWNGCWPLAETAMVRFISMIVAATLSKTWAFYST
jgi:acyl-CoA reductase-like NAD-dependent aldehyde dehydrogenase